SLSPCWISSYKGYWSGELPNGLALLSRLDPSISMTRWTAGTTKLCLRPAELQLDLDLHAGGKLQAHQGLHGLGGGLDDVDQPLVGAALELLAAVLVLVDGAQDGDDFLLGGQ